MTDLNQLKQVCRAHQDLNLESPPQACTKATQQMYAVAEGPVTKELDDNFNNMAFPPNVHEHARKVMEEGRARALTQRFAREVKKALEDISSANVAPQAQNLARELSLPTVPRARRQSLACLASVMADSSLQSYKASEISQVNALLKYVASRVGMGNLATVSKDGYLVYFVPYEGARPTALLASQVADGIQNFLLESR